MRSSRSRAKVLFIAVVLVVVALPAAPASASGESSQITTPAGLSFPFILEEQQAHNRRDGHGFERKSTSGATTASAIPSYYALASKVPVIAGAFSVEVAESALPAEVCQLRAVASGVSLALPPGEKEAFEGPTVVASQFLQEPSDYNAASSTLTGSFVFQSAGDYALESTLYSPSGHEDVQLFYGEVDLEAFPPIGSRSTVQVDGANAYVPEAAREVEFRLREEAESKKEAFTPPAGKPSVTVRPHFEESTHQIKLEEEDPVVRCSPGVAFPPTLASCTSFVSAGVALHRTWLTTDEDHVAAMTDRWSSTDGAAHSVNVRYFNEMSSTENDGSYQFPGESSFSLTATGESKTLPAGPGTILYKTAQTLSELGNGEYPQGAILFDAAPSEPIKVTSGSTGEPASSFEMPYQRTIPAGGSSTTLRMTFVQAFELPEVRSLAASALAGYAPAVTIASPLNGVTVSTPSVTVSGTASDAVELSSLTVDGTAVAVAATGGSWSTSVALKPGANTITATATDQAGISSTAVVTVTYAPPKPPPPPATASQVGSASGAKGQASVTLGCNGTPGTSCKIHVTLTTVEKSRHGHLIAVLAAKTHSQRVTIATATIVIPAGQRIKVVLRLNATGRKLLARFGKLPAHLTAILEGEGAHHIVIAQNLTIRPVPKKHKH